MLTAVSYWPKGPFHRYQLQSGPGQFVHLVSGALLLGYHVFPTGLRNPWLRPSILYKHTFRNL